MLNDLVAADARPRTLFEDDTDKRVRLMIALDENNGRFGKWTAVTASQGFGAIGNCGRRCGHLYGQPALPRHRPSGRKLNGVPS
jgi:hypothetical protein